MTFNKEDLQRDEFEDKVKPHRGTIEDWYQEKVIGGSVIVGTFIKHPYLGQNDKRSCTSLIVSNDGHEIETLNSRYTLGCPRNTRTIK